MSFFHPTTPKKFRKGAAFTGLDDFMAHVNAGGWVYFNHKPYHHGWARSWQCGWVAAQIRYERLVRAEPNPDHPANKPKAPVSTFRDPDFEVVQS